MKKNHQVTSMIKLDCRTFTYIYFFKSSSFCNQKIKLDDFSYNENIKKLQNINQDYRWDNYFQLNLHKKIIFIINVVPQIHI